MKTLKLDLSYRPVAIIDCLEALVMCIVGKAVAVEEQLFKCQQGQHYLER